MEAEMALSLPPEPLKPVHGTVNPRTLDDLHGFLYHCSIMGHARDAVVMIEIDGHLRAITGFTTADPATGLPTIKTGQPE